MLTVAIIKNENKNNANTSTADSLHTYMYAFVSAHRRAAKMILKLECCTVRTIAI